MTDQRSCCCCLNHRTPGRFSTSLKVRKSDGAIIRHFDGQWINGGASAQTVLLYEGRLLEYSRNSGFPARQRFTVWDVSTFEMIYQTALDDGGAISYNAGPAGIYTNGTYIWVGGFSSGGEGHVWCLDYITGELLAEDDLLVGPFGMGEMTDGGQLIGPGASENTCQIGPYVELDEDLTVTQEITVEVGEITYGYGDAYLNGDTYCLWRTDSVDNEIITIDRSDLSTQTVIGNAPSTSQLTGFDGTYYVWSDGGVYDLATNSNVWTASGGGSTFVLAHDDTYFYAANNITSKLTKYKKSDGTVSWTTTANFRVNDKHRCTAIDSVNDLIIHAGYLDEFFATNISDGSEEWRKDLQTNIFSGNVIVDPESEYAYIGRQRGQIYA